MNSAWTIPDEAPTVCDTCGARTYDADHWFQDLTGTFCPDHGKDEPPC